MNREEYFEFIKNSNNLRLKVNSDPYRLHFHLMPPMGWLNDPNGLCVIKGVNHIYFQYTPFSATWGMKLWGHYSTENWIDYKEHDAFLFPDIKEDKDGVYSGSAFVENDEVHYFYTGNVKYTDKKYDYILNGREQNVIELISKDGFNYKNKIVLLKNSDYPKNMSTHVRDPKVFKIENDYFMILGARSKDNKGCAILYKSTDLKKWDYYMEIKSNKYYGYMWECCDLVKVEDVWFLICCPQGIEQDGINFANIYQIGYFLININFKEKTYNLGEFIELDRGFDIYASQTFIDNKGRTVLIAWMGIPDANYTNNKTILEEKLPNKEIEAEKKIDIADEKAKEVERLKALLQKAENEFYFANKEKEEAISDRDNTKERIQNIDSLIKNNESKIVENKEKITIIPREVETLKEGLEEKKNVIAFRQEQLEKVFNNVKEKEQDYKNTKENALEKVLEYESYIKSLYEKKLEAEEEKKLEVAERYRKEIEEYQQNLIKQNIEWDRINKLNREIAEQVRLEREQKALAKKKLEAEARAKIELEEKIKTDLQNFINLIDKGKITNEDLIEMVDDLDECENWKDSHKLQYGKNIKFYLSDLENTIKVKSFFREADEVNKIIYTNEKLFKRISKYMDNIKEEKAIPNAKGVDKTVKEVEKVKKEEKEFE